ncbi:MAG: NAD(P)H-dependent oxidoreductase [Patescibacteria group bacterium]
MQPLKKTLLVEYAPRGERSRTKKLRKYFTDYIEDVCPITHVDLCSDLPSLMNTEVINAYEKRNYLGEELTTKESKLLSTFDKARDQLLNHEVLILSSPIYNFGYPAPVKAWIDSVMQRGYTYTTDEQGHRPLLQHLTVLIIYTAGIIYDQISENEDWNGLMAEGPKLFEYMGASEVRMVHVQGMDMLPKENLDFRIFRIAHAKLRNLAERWYNVDTSSLNNTAV